MTSDDLRHLVNTVATEGTDKVRLDEDRLLPRIRRRRRRRLAITGLTAVGATAVIAVGAYAVLPGGTPDAEVAKKPTPAEMSPLDCGSPLAKGFPPRVPSGLEGLLLTSPMVKGTPTGWGGSLTFDVKSPRTLEWLADSTELAVVQDYKVVGKAVLTFTKPPASPMLLTNLDLRPCDPGGPVPGTVMLYGKLFPGQHPISFFELRLIPR
jgi:hypothetical protein